MNEKANLVLMHSHFPFLPLSIVTFFTLSIHCTYLSPTFTTAPIILHYIIYICIMKLMTDEWTETILLFLGWQWQVLPLPLALISFHFTSFFYQCWHFSTRSKRLLQRTKDMCSQWKLSSYLCICMFLSVSQLQKCVIFSWVHLVKVKIGEFIFSFILGVWGKCTYILSSSSLLSLSSTFHTQRPRKS